MEESDRNRCRTEGTTLVEVMVAMIVFMLIVGMTGRLLSTAVSYPFSTRPVEPWLNYMEEITRQYQRLPIGSLYLQTGTFSDPFPAVEKPADFIRLNMAVTEDSELPGLAVARFHVTNSHEKTYGWRSYRLLR